MIEPDILPDEPDKYGVLVQDGSDPGYGFHMRWTPGAFGDRETIKGVISFRVLEDSWHEDETTGLAYRTITKAEVLQFHRGCTCGPDGCRHRP